MLAGKSDSEIAAMSDTKSPTPQAASTDVPKPMPFAVMRNSHEALRSSIRLQEQRLDEGDLAGFSTLRREFQRALAVHMAMEDKFMFDLLDDVGSGAISTARLPDEHVQDMMLAAAVDDALTGDDFSALRTAWSAWKEDHLHHLEHEEAVMMPLTVIMATTPEARTRLPRSPVDAKRAVAELRLVHRLGGEHGEPTRLDQSASQCRHPCLCMGIAARLLGEPVASIAANCRGQLHA
jgi:Hemerythrin HHE cation binding domain